MVAFIGSDGEELGAVVRGSVDGRTGVPVRLHSACFTGDLMGSLRCDCRDQLEAALTFVGRAERGVVLYLPQEGRGIGLVNKIRAYGLQEQGLDTVEANIALGFPDDLRDYDVAAAMLHALGIESVCLLTNNPRKVEGLRKYGVPVIGRIPLRTRSNEFNALYLETKRQKSGHLL
jgi:GTP cyclohydrolase II